MLFLSLSIYRTAALFVGDVAVSNIMKGLQQPDVIPHAVSCLSKLLDVYDVSQGHAKVLLSQLISLVEDKTDHQHRVAGLYITQEVCM